MSDPTPPKPPEGAPRPPTPAGPAAPVGEARPKEIGGRKGPDPTRFGDWERDGRCIDF